nr:uncharacterized protein LOC104088984 [Nicotiana tomentosiformis]
MRKAEKCTRQGYLAISGLYKVTRSGWCKVLFVNYSPKLESFGCNLGRKGANWSEIGTKLQKWKLSATASVGRSLWHTLQKQRSLSARSSAPRWLGRSQREFSFFD